MRILHVGYGFRPWRAGGLIAYAEDVMEGQARRGHEVAYFFRGRHYPGLPDDRLRTWRRRSTAMHEILNSSLVFGGDTGTLTPEADLDHAPSEAHFASVLDDVRPDVVHVQELIGLPTAVLEIARARAVPVVATLQDYLPLCPVLKLFDVDHQICLRHQVGEQCARCSSHAPEGREAFAKKTAMYESRRVLGARGAELVARGLRGGRRVGRRLRRRGDAQGNGHGVPRERAASASRYQARRDVNLERLSRVDMLVAQSRRVAEIYSHLGVDERRMRVMQLTLAHMESLTPRTISEPPEIVRFATANGATSVAKGADVLLGALADLHERGLTSRFALTVIGYAPPEVASGLRRFPNVELRDGYPPEEVDHALHEFDVGIVPSAWEEAYGYIGPEFLAKGIPVVGNARGGIVDYTRDGETGWVNETADAAGLAAIMADIVSRPEQVSERNRWLLEHRDAVVKPMGRHLDELDALYEEVVAAGERGESRLRKVVGRG